MKSIYHLDVANKISVLPEAVWQSVPSVWQTSIFLHLSVPVLSSGTWWKTTDTLALLLGAHLVDTWYMWPSITNTKNSDQHHFLRTSGLWKNVGFISSPLCLWVPRFFSFSHLLTYLCAKIFQKSCLKPLVMSEYRVQIRAKSLNLSLWKIAAWLKFRNLEICWYNDC